MHPNQNSKFVIAQVTTLTINGLLNCISRSLKDTLWNGIAKHNTK